MNRFVLALALVLSGCGGGSTFSQREGFVYLVPPKQELAQCEAKAQQLIYASNSPFATAMLTNGNIKQCMQAKGYDAK